MWWLIIAHFIADWGLQNRWMAENKAKYIEILTAHCIIYAGTISLFLHHFGGFELWKIWFVGIGHFMIDFITSKWAYNRNMGLKERFCGWIICCILLNYI